MTSHREFLKKSALFVVASVAVLWFFGHLNASAKAGEEQKARHDAGRTTISLDGTWQIDESVSATEVPKKFDHTVVVPGLVNLAKSGFPNVDLFASREYLIRFGRQYPWGGPEILANNAPLPAIGIPAQKRNYFWYQRTFTAPQQREVALLRIGKSQFGTAVWLNGKPVGENLSCWTAGYFNLTDAMNWAGENRLLVRIGAHPAVLPANIPGAGTCSSKHKWMPGIYDVVNLILCDNPVIESIQAAPLINTSEVVIQTKLKNYGSARTFELSHVVKSWKEGKEVARGEPRYERIEAGEGKTFTQTIKIPQARFWSPEDPFLYVIESGTNGDNVRTRFGMREYRFDNKKRVGFLNGKPYYLRGGNIELFLHAEDPLCGDRPWDRAWVKKLVAEIPKKQNWNAFRFSMSPIPDFWLDIADEEGILVQLEPIVFGDRKEWSSDEFVKEFSRWMRDNWNHPCVFMWDSNNETSWPEMVKVINTVRPLDLSNRTWDNGFGPPLGPNDPEEVHPYVIGNKPNLNFDLRELNHFDGPAYMLLCPGRKRPDSSPNCYIINEYCGLWLYPDGVPLDISEGIYSKALPGGTADDRIEYRWYFTAGLTEMWRAQRCAAGVFYYEYLGSYLPRAKGPYHFGAFADLATLRLQPGFEKYMTEAFKPLGLYIDFWGDGKPGNWLLQQWVPIRGGENRKFTVSMINDDQEPVDGKLVLSLENLDGKPLASSEKPFRVDGAGKDTYELTVPIPKENGKYLLKAAAYPHGTRYKSATVSQRKVSVESW